MSIAASFVQIWLKDGKATAGSDHLKKSDHSQQPFDSCLYHTPQGVIFICHQFGSKKSAARTIVCYKKIRRWLKALLTSLLGNLVRDTLKVIPRVWLKACSSLSHHHPGVSRVTRTPMMVPNSKTDWLRSEWTLEMSNPGMGWEQAQSEQLAHSLLHLSLKDLCGWRHQRLSGQSV